ncbi:hypothetical protein AX16_000791 [Volvariella volvacea WC 439]|nr:hypothetical protein AX16_000791 [Volvariella volvacea WC 439]
MSANASGFPANDLTQQLFMAGETDTQHVASNDTDWVRVTSTDGYSFMVKRKVANGIMLRHFREPALYISGADAAFELFAIGDPNGQRSGIIVEKLVQYMLFKSYYEGVAPREEVPVNEFMERIPPEIVLELLLAADYQESM